MDMITASEAKSKALFKRASNYNMQLATIHSAIEKRAEQGEFNVSYSDHRFMPEVIEYLKTLQYVVKENYDQRDGNYLEISWK